MPDLQVTQIVRAEAGRGAPPLGDRREAVPAPGQELAVSRVGVDHVLPLGVKEVLEHEADVLFIQIRRRLQTQLETAIAGPVLGERFQLHQE